MPNWCNNRLQLVGKGTDVLAFVNDGIRTALAGRTSFEEKDEKITKELVKLSDICVDTFPRFSSWYPMPSNFLELEKLGYHKGTKKELTDEVKELINKTIAECGTSDWHSWCCGNWGCKWDIKPWGAKCFGDTEDDETTLVLDYDSAWSPNIDWLIEVGEKYPHLRFYLDYYEPGMNFDGGATVEDGEYCDCEVDEEWKEQFVWTDDEEIEEEIEDELTPNQERETWFNNLLIRELVSTEEFFHVWADYNCTSPQAFANVCNDIWCNGWSEYNRWNFYEKYKDTFKGEKTSK